VGRTRRRTCAAGHGRRAAGTADRTKHTRSLTELPDLFEQLFASVFRPFAFRRDDLARELQIAAGRDVERRLKLDRIERRGDDRANDVSVRAAFGRGRSE
jgi:hypothetical protein